MNFPGDVVIDEFDMQTFCATFQTGERYTPHELAKVFLHNRFKFGFGQNGFGCHAWNYAPSFGPLQSFQSIKDLSKSLSGPRRNSNDQPNRRTPV
jgi:hypothetical protein